VTNLHLVDDTSNHSNEYPDNPDECPICKHGSMEEAIRHEPKKLGLYWLDFQQPKGSFITIATGPLDALRKAYGQHSVLDNCAVACRFYPEEEICEDFRDRLLSWDEAETLFKRIIDDRKGATWDWGADIVSGLIKKIRRSEHPLGYASFVL
jgi:hypothetical protein